jgi:hypothetical protein
MPGSASSTTLRRLAAAASIVDLPEAKSSPSIVQCFHHRFSSDERGQGAWQMKAAGFARRVSKLLFKITEVFGAAFFKSCEKAAFFVKRRHPKNFY